MGLVVAWGFWKAFETSLPELTLVQAADLIFIYVVSVFGLVGLRFLLLQAGDALVDGQGKIRPFILYLRPFRVDVGLLGWVTERQLAHSFKCLGVPVCVGRPGERLPPNGFYRIYFANADWQESVLAMATRAKCIVLVVGDTDSLRWEIQQVIDQKLLPKTILLIPARRHDERRAVLQDQHHLAIPDLQSHYSPPVIPRGPHLCPVEFDGTTAKPVAVIPTPHLPLWAILPVSWPVYPFLLVMRIVMFVFPWTKRYAWLVDTKSWVGVNYAATLKPVLSRIDGYNRMRTIRKMHDEVV